MNKHASTLRVIVKDTPPLLSLLDTSHPLTPTTPRPHCAKPHHTLTLISIGSSRGVGGGAKSMKAMWPPLAAIFFMTYLYRAGGGGHGPLGTPLDPLLLINHLNHPSPHHLLRSPSPLNHLHRGPDPKPLP